MDELADLEEQITLLFNRKWGDKNRLFRKLAEEMGEYAEAFEYQLGSSGKIEKFKNKATPEQKLHEEICDVVMMALCLARMDGLSINEVLNTIYYKLKNKEATYREKLKETNDEKTINKNA